MCEKERADGERAKRKEKKKQNTEKAQKISLGMLKRKKKMTDIESAKKADPWETASVMQIN